MIQVGEIYGPIVMRETHSNVYNFIESYTLEHYYVPSMKEITEATGHSLSTVQNVMSDMIGVRLLETDIPEKAYRAYRVTRLVEMFKKGVELCDQEGRSCKGNR